MVMYCNILTCKNFTGVRKGIDEECRFFRTPIDIEQRDRWISEIQKYQKIDQRLSICELHFDQKYFIFGKRGIRLTKDAIPTIFEPTAIRQTALTDAVITPNEQEQPLNPEETIKCEQNLELDPPVQELITCDRCIQQDAKIAQLQATCDEQQEIIQGLRKEIQVLKHPDLVERTICDVNEPIIEIIESHVTEQRIEKTLPMHRRSVSRERFECVVCKMKFTSNIDLQNHSKRTHISHSTCVVCIEKSFELDVHICTGLKSLNCSYCQQECASTKSLLQHLKDCNTSEKIAHKCDYCKVKNNYFFMESLLSIHTKSHQNNTGEFICDICTKSFGTEKCLGSHMKRHFPSRVLCDECGKEFSCKSGLKKHKRIHDGKKFKCQKCGKIFNTEAVLKSHMSFHVDLTVVCKICGAKASSFKALYKHKKIHTRTEADRKHACKLCSLRFFTSHNLQKHMQNVHLANERYDCEYCKQSYKHSGDLYRHLRTHLGDDMYACPTCPKRFRYKLELERHSSEHYVAAENDDNDKMETA